MLSYDKGEFVMAVELQYLYKEIRPEYEVKLHTASCFDRKISWIHMVEGSEFARFLYEVGS